MGLNEGMLMHRAGGQHAMHAAEEEEVDPTPQQDAILNSTRRRVRINARSGTGKTTTLRLLGKRLVGRGKRALYLVYNKRACEEARGKLRDVANVYTVHGFALRSVPSTEALKSRKRTNLKPVHLLAEFESLGEGRQRAAVIACRFLQYFLNSTHKKLEDAAEVFASDELHGALRGEFLSHAAHTIHVLRRVMKQWLEAKADCPHDFYLWLANRKGWLAENLARFDVLLVDEAQDLSPVMLSAVEQFAGRAFVVGDSHQQIYEFRYAIDALSRLGFDEEYDLSLSFRFGKSIAALASSLITQAGGEHSFRIDGNPRKNSVVVLPGTGHGRLPPGSAIIARTNTSLFETAVPMLQTHQALVFSRDMGEILERAMSVYGVWSGERRCIRDRFLHSFSYLEELKQHAERLDDRELLLLIRFVENHKHGTPRLLDQLRAVPTTDERPANAAVMLTTVHGAKGLEFDDVRLCDDIFSKLKAALTKDPAELAAEVNLTYVAITRARHRLYLPPAAMELPIAWPQPGSTRVSQFKTGLGPGRKPVEREAAPARPRPSAGTVQSRVDTCGVSGKRTSVPDQRQIRTRVQTPIGPGYLVPGGEKAGTVLVKLDNEAAPVRLVTRCVKRI